MNWKGFTDVWWVEITGMDIRSLDLKIEAGNFPKISFKVCMNLLIEKRSEEELVKLKELVDKEIQCRKEMIPKKGFKVELH